MGLQGKRTQGAADGWETGGVTGSDLRRHQGQQPVRTSESVREQEMRCKASDRQVDSRWQWETESLHRGMERVAEYKGERRKKSKMTNKTVCRVHQKRATPKWHTKRTQTAGKRQKEEEK